ALFDATVADVGGASTVASQPIAVPMTIVRRASGGFVGMVATGGADWLKHDAISGVRYHIYGIDLAGDSPVPALFALDVPLNTPPDASFTADGRPLRIYAQPIVFGTDLFAQGTTLALSAEKQLLQPLLHPTQSFGRILHWTLGADVVTSDAALTVLPLAA